MLSENEILAFLAQTRTTLFEGATQFSRFIWDNTTHDHILAFGTVLIAVFTFTLWRSTKRLWEANERQLKLAREEFMSTHRPKLIVRQFQVDPVCKDQPITVRYAIVNIGNTDAILKLIACEIGLWNVDHFELPGIDTLQKEVAQNHPPIKGGQRVQIDTLSKFTVTEIQLNSILAGDFIISILGEITYADALGTRHRTGFRRVHDRKTDKFTPSPYQDEEYCD
jgi:hypothetical protein